MKKTVLCCMLSMAFTANSHAQAIDLFDDDTLNSPSAAEVKTEQKAQQLEIGRAHV